MWPMNLWMNANEFDGISSILKFWMIELLLRFAMDLNFKPPILSNRIPPKCTSVLFRKRTFDTIPRDFPTSSVTQNLWHPWFRTVLIGHLKQNHFRNKSSQLEENKHCKFVWKKHVSPSPLHLTVKVVYERNTIEWLHQQISR